MSIELLTDGIIDLIKKNLIAKTNLISDASVGDTTLNVYNSYRFHKGEEIVLIDFGYNVSGHIHNGVMEYAKVKEIINTNEIVVESELQGDWKLSDQAFIQKTIGHSPLYEENVFYGDREVLPVEDMAITVEPVSLGNEWVYFQGGLSEEYRVRIMVYGKSITFNEGRRILDRYSWAVYSLLINNLHLDANDKDTPLLANYNANASTVVIADTPLNQEIFEISQSEDGANFRLQDNLGSTCWTKVTDRVINGDGTMTLTLRDSFDSDFSLSEFAVLRKIGIYVYDSRVDGIQYGQVSKGSAFLRAGEISWFGKTVNELRFMQSSDGVDDFDKISP